MKLDMLIKFKLQDEEESLRKCFKIDEEKLLRNCWRKTRKNYWGIFEERWAKLIEELCQKDELLTWNCWRKIRKGEVDYELLKRERDLIEFVVLQTFTNLGSKARASPCRPNVGGM